TLRMQAGPLHPTSRSTATDPGRCTEAPPTTRRARQIQGATSACSGSEAEAGQQARPEAGRRESDGFLPFAIEDIIHGETQTKPRARLPVQVQVHAMPVAEPLLAGGHGGIPGAAVVEPGKVHRPAFRGPPA